MNIEQNDAKVAKENIGWQFWRWPGEIRFLGRVRASLDERLTRVSRVALEEREKLTCCVKEAEQREEALKLKCARQWSDLHNMEGERSVLAERLRDAEILQENLRKEIRQLQKEVEEGRRGRREGRGLEVLEGEELDRGKVLAAFAVATEGNGIWMGVQRVLAAEIGSAKYAVCVPSAGGGMAEYNRGRLAALLDLQGELLETRDQAMAEQRKAG